MSRWIEYDDAIERLGAYLMADAQIEWGGIASEDIEDWKEIATDILKGSPSIDICFCRECKHWRNGDGACGVCRKTSLFQITKADDFCSYGQKGDENVEAD